MTYATTLSCPDVGPAAPVRGVVHGAFFADLDPEHEDALADILAVVHESLLREGTLPRPDLG
ncbi:hypothetical protein [Mycolicibacterium murale]|uniref:hypothetical protein n=1 Tax=Mycolicibacterium murale TaxID=182220 RepID=UPI001875920B|nr:hypothetical protein [Mycolicibacterium murale]MCV7184360.1 hypothetical protein [Mycolicibacterium murale]